MSSSAIIMLIVAVSLIWGGLGIALIHMWRHPEDLDADQEVTKQTVPWSKATSS